MIINDFLEKANGNYRFFKHEQVKNRGFATIEDEICEIVYNEDDKYFLVRVIDMSQEEYEKEFYLNSMEELLEFEVNGKTIRELIELEKELLYYHVNTIVV